MCAHYFLNLSDNLNNQVPEQSLEVANGQYQKCEVGYHDCKLDNKHSGYLILVIDGIFCHPRVIPDLLLDSFLS